jgi:hypothetical protein
MICRRCGIEDQRGQILKRVERGGSQECSSCLARPSSSIRTAYGICRPHKGELDENDRPLDHRGKLFREGKRLCGSKDCITKSHIVKMTAEEKALEAERLDISYRTGKKLGWDDLIQSAKKEGRKIARHNESATGHSGTKPTNC